MGVTLDPCKEGLAVIEPIDAPQDRPAVDDPLDRPLREWLDAIAADFPEADAVDVRAILRLLRINIPRAVKPDVRWPRPRVWFTINPTVETAKALVPLLEVLAARLPERRYRPPAEPATAAPAEPAPTE